MASDEVLLVALMVVLGGWIAWLFFRRQQFGSEARMKRAEVFNKLLDKFGTANEFVEFMETEQGKMFLENPLPYQVGPQKVVLRFVQVGIILLALSVALIANWVRISNYVHAQSNPDINWVSKEWDYYYWWVLTLSLAVGMFIIAFVTKTLLGRWRLNGKGTEHIQR